ncbi:MULTISPECIES: hypothetical protein [Flavobacterium]|uniref:Transposase n=1 Tax=Flavobacterium gawalongense TaxID=2594432 RepID=A0ABY3CPW6_9FLAO|nr:hypothetical protein [Flavobacterium gawalongense]TRX03231.1 hypothetical protein FNW33_05215 [Flavobacterium gawalongense]TRX09893.1 hypothetical protein FNW12_01905 [Flavobacterium gawalongense]
MNIDSQNRGGGFIAKSILNSYGVLAEHKKIINDFNINQIIENSNGVLKETLIALKLKLI